jgi:hypothetical protein
LKESKIAAHLRYQLPSEAARHRIVIDLTLRTTNAQQAPTLHNVLPKANLPMVIILIILTTHRGRTIAIRGTLLARIFSIVSQIQHNHRRLKAVIHLHLHGVIDLVHRGRLDGVALIHRWDNDLATTPIIRP